MSHDPPKHYCTSPQTFGSDGRVLMRCGRRCRAYLVTPQPGSSIRRRLYVFLCPVCDTVGPRPHISQIDTELDEWL